MLGIVANKDDKDGMAPAPDTISAHHGNLIFTSGTNWTQYLLHIGIKQVCKGMMASRLVLYASQLSCQNVSN